MNEKLKVQKLIEEGAVETIFSFKSYRRGLNSLAQVIETSIVIDVSGRSNGDRRLRIDGSTAVRTACPLKFFCSFENRQRLLTWGSSIRVRSASMHSTRVLVVSTSISADCIFTLELNNTRLCFRYFKIVKNNPGGILPSHFVCGFCYRSTDEFRDLRYRHVIW